MRSPVWNVPQYLIELGGKSAHIVLDDADFTMVLPGAAAMACAMSLRMEKLVTTRNVAA